MSQFISFWYSHTFYVSNVHHISCDTPVIKMNSKHDHNWNNKIVDAPTNGIDMLCNMHLMSEISKHTNYWFRANQPCYIHYALSLSLYMYVCLVSLILLSLMNLVHRIRNPATWFSIQFSIFLIFNRNWSIHRSSYVYRFKCIRTLVHRKKNPNEDAFHLRKWSWKNKINSIRFCFANDSIDSSLLIHIRLKNSVGFWFWFIFNFPLPFETNYMFTWINIIHPVKLIDIESVWRQNHH